MRMFGIVVGLIVASPAVAQMSMPETAPVCVKAEVVPGFEAWGKSAGAAQLAIGGASTLALAPADAVKFSPPLNRAAAPGDFGGVYGITIVKGGTYRFALAPGAWIDVIARGERLPSAAHTHGPACSGIAKIVDYALEPGDYVVQFSAVKVPKLAAMVVAR
ncbi:homogentisate 1,2-dioxygenase [Sphingomonas bacterium]|uniref:homogentisate 1,2-dioxygenase n=1 Tax=Sphingomonas bacterium TaxID=1895847 RepID=UPI00157733A6|nr:homogentisate 1,2-dioxygenase [Sphingomonas bacterium]